MIDRKRKENIINDRGSTLITVIVAIAFVTILMAIILGASVVNIRLKAADRKTKDKFYYAEKALNDIYTGIGQLSAEEAGKQYEILFRNMGDTYTFSDEAENAFRKAFIQNVKTQISYDAIDSMTTLFEGYIVPVTGITYKVIVKKTPVYELYDGSTVTTDGSTVTAATAQRIRIRDVEVTATDNDSKFQAVISTDIIIEVPTTDFLSENVDVTDYSIIANKGLYINGAADVKGNVYAGIHASTEYATDSDVVKDSNYGAEKVFGGINIRSKSGSGDYNKVSINGNYIVSKGDINVSGETGYGPSVSIGNNATDESIPNVFFDTLRTCPKTSASDTSEYKMDIKANLFALNDLELNANNSSVTLKGNYYGYNDKTLPSTEHSFSKTERHDDADSSAIIINGNKSKLDMTGLKSLVLMGKAYVDFEKGAQSGISTETELTKTEVAATAEGVALKTNQQIYLVPADLLESPNPIVSESGSFTFVNAKVGSEDKIKDWFGYPFIDSSRPYRTYKVKLDDTNTVYYAYLNFNEKLWDEAESDDDLVDPDFYYGFKESTALYAGDRGAVSSMDAFFKIIMNSKKIRQDYIQAKINKYPNTMSAAEKQLAAEREYDDLSTTPSPITIHDRVLDSMGYDYFDLQGCIVGDDSTILYSKNAAVSYKKGSTTYDTEVKENNSGMERFAGYPQYLFHRYQWLATRLDANQNVPLGKDPSDAAYHSESETNSMKSDWIGSGNGYYSTPIAPPLSRFVDLTWISGEANVDTNTTAMRNAAKAAGLSENVYGHCLVVKGNSITINSNFKGVAIVNGDITVASGKEVDGLLMATGVIVLEDGAKVYYDKGLIRSRIEKEMSIIKEGLDPTATSSDYYKPYYLISYLKNESGREYNVSYKTKEKERRIEADYHDFMFYENWRKGPAE